MLHDYGSKLPKNRDLFRTYLWWCPYSSNIQMPQCFLLFRQPRLINIKKGNVSYSYIKEVLLQIPVYLCSVVSIGSSRTGPPNNPAMQSGPDRLLPGYQSNMMHSREPNREKTRCIHENLIVRKNDAFTRT